jgi:ATP-dependent Lon protease
VEEIEARYLKGLKIHYVEHMKSVLDLALMKEKVAEPIIIEPKKKS